VRNFVFVDISALERFQGRWRFRGTCWLYLVIWARCAMCDAHLSNSTRPQKLEQGKPALSG